MIERFSDMTSGGWGSSTGVETRERNHLRPTQPSTVCDMLVPTTPAGDRNVPQARA
jgi:hypothetical protein